MSQLIEKALDMRQSQSKIRYIVDSEIHASRGVGTLGKSFTRNCLYDVLWLPCG